MSAPGDGQKTDMGRHGSLCNTIHGHHNVKDALSSLLMILFDF